MPFQFRKTSTRAEIIRLAAKLYLHDGYSATSLSKIARLLDISQGNITFYFPTKEHLLSVVINELCDFLTHMMETEADEGISSMLAYCMELASIATVSELNDIARDLFHAAYSSPLALSVIRENDTAKAKKIFSKYCEGWTEERWIWTESIASGIEYAMITTENEDVSLAIQIEYALDAVLSLYNVPEDIRKQKIHKVLDMDYQTFGCRLFESFKEYTQKANDEALKQQLEYQNRRDPWKY